MPRLAQDNSASNVILKNANRIAMKSFTLPPFKDCRRDTASPMLIDRYFHYPREKAHLIHNELWHASFTKYSKTHLYPRGG